MTNDPAVAIEEIRREQERELLEYIFAELRGIPQALPQAETLERAQATFMAAMKLVGRLLKKRELETGIPWTEQLETIALELAAET